MIDRFNFYDVYGYLLPGLALVALLGLPGVMIAGKLPSSELVSALAAVAAAYVIGQLAHAFARAFFERERPFAAKLAELSVPAKARLERRLAEACGRPIAITDKSVFDICRRVLQDQKRGQVADELDPVWWTPIERRIRCRPWTRRRGRSGHDGASPMSSRPERCGWCSRRARPSRRWRVISI